jgi:Ni/Fe-hydrogenase subunit HybB-like protein
VLLQIVAPLMIVTEAKARANERFIVQASLTNIFIVKATGSGSIKNYAFK